jgi:hypothetical protein
VVSAQKPIISAVQQLVALIIGAVVGAFVGYLFRASEFRRDQRLRVYGEFVGGFLDVVRTGVLLQSFSLNLGDLRQVKDPDHRTAYTDAWKAHDPARINFEEAGARLRLIASQRVRAEAVTVEDWVTDRVHGVPPFTLDGEFSPKATARRRGPASVQAESVAVARAFADVAGRDVSGWFRRSPGRG